MTSPADEITAAAERLRHLAGVASPGPWRTTGIGDFGWTVSMPSSGLSIEAEDSEQGAVDCDYIATVHPAVGAALADWLDSAADYFHRTPGREHALAVARAINAGGCS